MRSCSCVDATAQLSVISEFSFGEICENSFEHSESDQAAEDQAEVERSHMDRLPLEDVVVKVTACRNALTKPHQSRLVFEIARLGSVFDHIAEELDAGAVIRDYFLECQNESPGVAGRADIAQEGQDGGTIML